ncbi:MAG: GntR family transcriptional regulator [Proteobacteria bacterium]|nr:GntR family transcriptional regulator [Pseudomonadota bacterium]
MYSYVKESILHGRWEPGDCIDDLQLSKELGVSRISVREALSKLAENRILHRQHWKGFHVRELSWDEIESIIDVRMSLEHLALEKCLERMNSGFWLLTPVFPCSRCPNFSKTGDTLCHGDIFETCHEVWTLLCRWIM